MFVVYSRSVGMGFCFDGFDEELAGLPGEYAPPGGELLVAFDDSGSILGCVALRPLKGDLCELKRLYVEPDSRGRGIGRILVQEMVRVAEGLGYRAMNLDTLSQMEAAQRLYRELGFVVIDRYNDHDGSDVVFMTRLLTSR